MKRVKSHVTAQVSAIHQQVQGALNKNNQPSNNSQSNHQNTNHSGTADVVMSTLLFYRDVYLLYFLSYWHYCCKKKLSVNQRYNIHPLIRTPKEPIDLLELKQMLELSGIWIIGCVLYLVLEIF